MTHFKAFPLQRCPDIGVVPKSAPEAFRMQILWQSIAVLPNPVDVNQLLGGITAQNAALHAPGIA